MKKSLIKFTAAFSAVLLIVPFALSSCGSADGDTTAPAVPEETTEHMPTLDEMSPPTYKKELTAEYSVRYDDIDKSSFSELDADDAMIAGLDTEHIYKDANGREYYLLKDGSVVLSFIDGAEAYSAYYRENGKLKYFGDSETGWYFTDDGSVDMVSYTFSSPSGNEIITYYEPDGKRIVISAAGTYYNDNIDELSAAEQLEFTKRLGSAENEEETTS